MSCHITQLPAELYDVIFSELNRSDLTRLGYTCTELHHATNPHIYRCIHLILEIEKDSLDHLTLLLRTAILHRPDIATMVEEFSLTAQRPKDTYYIERFSDIIASFGQNVFSSSELEQMRLRIDEAGAAPDWQEAIIEYRDVNAMTAFMLSQFTCLESLSIPEVFLQKRPWDWIGRMLAGTGGRQTLIPGGAELRNLRHLVLGTADTSQNLESKNYPEIILVAAQIPTLESLECRGNFCDSYPDVDGKELASIGDQKGRLRTLSFVRTDVDPKLVAAVLKVQPQIQKLIIDYYTQESVHLDILRSGLNFVKDSLTHLSMRSEMWSSDGMVEYSQAYEGKLGSLADFKNLLELETSLPALFGKCSNYPNDNEQEHDGFIFFQLPPLDTYLPKGLRSLRLYNDLLELDYVMQNWYQGGWWVVMTKFFRGRGDFYDLPLIESLPHLQSVMMDMTKFGYTMYFGDPRQDRRQWYEEEHQLEGCNSLKNMAAAQGVDLKIVRS